jgi:hypothetical protein
VRNADSKARLPGDRGTAREGGTTALEMCAGASPRDARLMRIKNTLKLRRMRVSETLLPEVEKDERLRLVEEACPMRFGDDRSLF